MKASTTTLKILVEKGLPWVTPWHPLKRRPKYLPALATMFRRPHYVQISRIVGWPLSSREPPPVRYSWSLCSSPWGLGQPSAIWNPWPAIPSRNAACTLATTFCQLVASGVLSRVASIIHWRRCSALNSDRPPERFRQSLHNSQAISSSSDMESSTGNGWTPTGIGCPSGGTGRYSSTRSAVMAVMDNLDGDRGQYTASLYHPHIRIHASWRRDGSEARRDSTTDTALAALWRRPSWRLALIVQLTPLEFCWSLVRHVAILAFMRPQVSSYIHAW